MTAPLDRHDGWVRVTRVAGSMPDPANAPTWLNTAEISALVDVPEGTQVHLSSGEWMVVGESADQILGRTP